MSFGTNACSTRTCSLSPTLSLHSLSLSLSHTHTHTHCKRQTMLKSEKSFRFDEGLSTSFFFFIVNPDVEIYWRKGMGPYPDRVLKCP
jgi:hypothetical protein